MTENKKRMVWRNLLKYKCPECFNDMQRHDTGPHRCTVCNFKIGSDKFESMVDSMRATRAKRYEANSEEDNLSKLNNL